MIYASIEGENIAFWVILCFATPIAFAFLGRILWAMVALLEAIVPKNNQIRVKEKIVYRNSPQKIVYRDRRVPPMTAPVKNKEKIAYGDQPQKVKVEYRDRRVWGRDEAPAKNKEKTVTSTPATDPSIVAGAVNGLGSLGISKAEANLLVQKVCSSKAYFDIENLLKDCLSELK